MAPDAGQRALTFTEAGLRLASSMPRQSGPPWPPLPTALPGNSIVLFCHDAGSNLALHVIHDLELQAPTFTEAGLRLASSMPRRSGPPWPPLPTALPGSPAAVSLAARSSATGLGMRGKIVSK